VHVAATALAAAAERVEHAQQALSQAKVNLACRCALRRGCAARSPDGSSSVFSCSVAQMAAQTHESVMAKFREAMDQLAETADGKTDEVHVELHLPPPCTHPAVDKLRKVLLDGVAAVQAAIKKAAADLERRTVAASQHVQAVCHGMSGYKGTAFRPHAVQPLHTFWWWVRMRADNARKHRVRSDRHPEGAAGRPAETGPAAPQ